MRIDPVRGLWVRAPTPLGDFLAAEPSLRALHAAFRGRGALDRLVVTAPERMLALIEPRIRGARILPSGGSEAELVSGLRGLGAALLLTGSFRSAWMAFRARIPVRVGLVRDGRGPLLTDGVRPALERGGLPFARGVLGRSPRILPRPGSALYAELTGRLGVAVRDPHPRLAARHAVAQGMGDRLTAAGIDPGRPFLTAAITGPEGAAKAPPTEFWARVLARIHAELGWPVALASGPGEESLSRAVLAAIPEGAGFLPGGDGRALDLEELAALFSRSAAVLCGDTGPRHLARAVGTPSVVFAGATDPRHTALGRASESLLRRDLVCSPCHRGRCPRAPGADRECMSSLDPDDVLRALAERL